MQPKTTSEGSAFTTTCAEGPVSDEMVLWKQGKRITELPVLFISELLRLSKHTPHEEVLYGEKGAKA